MCRLQVNRMDGQGWIPWGGGLNMLVSMADHFIAQLASPSKLLRKVPPMSADRVALVEAEDGANALAAVARVVGGAA